jgi:hypothetical protein
MMPSSWRGGTTGCQLVAANCDEVVRQPGSGFANASAAAIEELLAAALRGDHHEMDVQRELLRYERSLDRCGMDPDIIVRLVAQAVDELGLGVQDAMAQPLDGLGDVRGVLEGGSFAWFEVKAQTKKDRFADLTQADWVRDETDLLRWIFDHEPDFASRLPPWVADLLVIEDSEGYFGGWTRDPLWLADMALVTSRESRLRAGIDSMSALRDFLDRKFVVHLTREGIRIVRLSLLGPVAGVLAGEPVAMNINYANRTAASIAFASPGPLARGRVQFTYHLGYPSRVVGRHKMHAVSLAQGPHTVEVRP